MRLQVVFSIWLAACVEGRFLLAFESMEAADGFPNRANKQMKKSHRQCPNKGLPHKVLSHLRATGVLL